MLLCPDCALLRPKLSPKNERMWKASCGHKGRHRPESKFYRNNYNSSPKDIITNYKMLFGVHENVLQKLPSPLIPQT